MRSATVEHRGHKMRAKYYGDLGRAKPPTASEMTTAKQILRVLGRHYPGHPWSIEVDENGGIAKFGIDELLGPMWGMVVHLDTWTEHQVKTLGGELLERFRMPRNQIDYYMSAAAKIPLLGRFRAKDANRIPT
jgi:hypothetical protein